MKISKTFIIIIIVLFVSFGLFIDLLFGNSITLKILNIPGTYFSKTYLYTYCKIKGGSLKWMNGDFGEMQRCIVIYPDGTKESFPKDPNIISEDKLPLIK